MLQAFGQQKPVVVDADNVVRAGTGLVRAARLLGWSQVAAYTTGLGGSEAIAYAIADNRTAELAEWDDPTLAALLDELRTEDALSGVGFDDTEIDELLAELAAEEAGEVDDPGPGEPPDEPVTKPGDLWILGNHRLPFGFRTFTWKTTVRAIE